MIKIFVLTFALFISGGFSAIPVFADNDTTQKLHINPEPLKPDDLLRPFNISEAFKLIIAAYEQEIKELENSNKLTDEERTKKIQKAKQNIVKFLELHDTVIDIAPLVLTFSIQGGIELPIPILRFIPIVKKLSSVGVAGLQGSIGVTLAMTRNRGTGKMHWKNFSIGFSTILGGNFTFGKPEGVRQGATRSGAGTQFLFPAIAVIVPLQETIPSTMMGDIQGVYWGIAGELSTDKGNLAKTPGTYQIGFYAKPNGIKAEFPNAGMIFFFSGWGAQESNVAVQLEGLYFGVVGATDGSTMMNPFPGINGFLEGNHYTSQHSEQNRMKKYSSKTILDAIAKGQQSLKKEIDKEKE